MTELTYDNYREVLEYEFQQEEKQPKTFLQIARQPHYENVISNILAFFLDTNEEHGLNDLFLSSFLDIVNNNLILRQKISFNSCKVRREDGMLNEKNERGRTDLMIFDENRRYLLIIESKIRAPATKKQLEKYKAFFEKKYKELSVYVILLSVEYNNIPGFLCINHFEFANKIQQNLSKYNTSSQDKYMVYLIDYLETIYSHYPEQSMKEDFKFFLENYEKIQKVIEIRNNLNDLVRDELRETGKKLKYTSEFVPKGKNHRTDEANLGYLNIPNFEEKIFYCLDFNNLFLDKSSVIPINLVVKNYDKNFPTVQSSTVSEKIKKLKEIDKEIVLCTNFRNEGWTNFASKKYDISNLGNNKLHEFLAESISNDFEPLKDELLTILTSTQK